MARRFVSCNHQRLKFHSGLTDALLEYAEAHFALSRPDARTGRARLQTLLEVAQQTGVVAPELRCLPSLPLGAEHVWGWFCDLSRARAHGFAGPLPLRWEGMKAFFGLLGVTPLNWEIRAIIRLDVAYISSRNGDAPGAIVSGASGLAAIARGGRQKRV